MQRPVLEADKIHPSIQEKVANYKSRALDEVRAAIAAHDVVVVGMTQNPFPRRARNLLDAKGIKYHYIGYGSYFSEWRTRLPLKMWTGWPTFPMIFVKGTFIGGYEQLKELLESGELARLISASA